MDLAVRIQTIGGDFFEVKVREDDKVWDLKAAIQKERGEDYSASKQKLVCKGTVLSDDEKALREYDIQRDDKVVCFVAKSKKNKPKKSPSTPPAESGGRDPSPAAPGAAPAAAAAPAESPAPGHELLEQLMSMGFPKEQCKAALEAADGIVEVATEYLMEGLPQAPLQPEGGSVVHERAVGEGYPEGQDSLWTPSFRSLDHLRRHPQFPEIQRVVQSNPNALQEVLQALGEQDPLLVAAIHNDPQAFLNVVHSQEEPGTGSGPDEEDGEDGAAAAAPAGEAEHRAMETDHAAGPSGGGHLGGASAVDEEVITRLMGITGCDRERVREAYEVCEGHEERAANYLLNLLDSS